MTTGMSPPNAVYRRVRTGCLTCRKRHMKCDERKPQCRHCEVAGRSCSFPGDDGYRPTKEAQFGGDGQTAFRFTTDHVWVDTPSSLRFVHQVRHESTERSQGEASATPPSAPVMEQVSSTEDVRSASPAVISPLEGVELQPSPRTPGAARHMAPDIPARHRSSVSYGPSPAAASEGLTTEVEMEFAGESPALSLHPHLFIYTPQPRQPLTDPVAAQLLQHYTDNLASWLDLSDPRHHFSVYVPHLALSCPILLNSILALSASHLSRIDASFDRTAALEYHSSCVRHLIPALEDSSLAKEAALPLSAVILRMQEMLGRENETDFQWHLRGCVSLFRLNRNNFRPGSLKHTAFWAYVRQEIATALQNNSATNVDTSDQTYHVVWEAETDETWTNHITWLAAKVINHCFGEPESQPSNLERRRALQQEVVAWRERLPDTFRPFSVIGNDGPFPLTSYLSCWHTAGMQFYHLCCVLLALHPAEQTTGIHLLRFTRHIEAEITKHTSQLCGIVRALTRTPECRQPGALVNATEILACCGRTLQTPTQQTALLDMLHEIEASTAWPARRAIQTLEEDWRPQNETTSPNRQLFLEDRYHRKADLPSPP